jgi:hypothetical protein
LIKAYHLCLAALWRFSGEKGKMQSRGNNNVPGFDCNSSRSVNIIHGLIEDGILSSRSDSSCSHRALGRGSMTLDAGLRWIHLCYGRHFAQPIIMAVHQTGVETRSTPHCAISRVIAGVFACTAIHNYSVFSNTSQSRRYISELGPSVRAWHRIVTQDDRGSRRKPTNTLIAVGRYGSRRYELMSCWLAHRGASKQRPEINT